MERIADAVYRLGSKWINFYLVIDSDAITLVDSGMQGYTGQVTAALAELGRAATDVKAIVLTHTHTDHIGGAKALMEVTGAPLFVHRGEAPIATGERKATPPKGILGNIWRPSMLAFVGHFIANGGAKSVAVPAVSTFEDDEVLDVPGKPRVVFTPGHSIAHCALLFEDHRALFCGDAMATLAVNTGETGAMLHPFNQDREGAVGSLGAIETTTADVMLPGHGEPFRGAPSEAVGLARRRLAT